MVATVDRTNTTVIHGTHRLVDLIPACMEVLKTENPAKAQRLVEQNPDIFDAFEDIGVAELTTPGVIWDMADFFNEALMEAMDEIAPAGCYFGAHPGDGADFGFWAETE